MRLNAIVRDRSQAKTIANNRDGSIGKNLKNLITSNTRDRSEGKTIVNQAP